MNEQISEILSTTMGNIKELVDMNAVFGEPINAPDGSMIVPVSKVSVGFASGGSEFGSKHEKLPFGGGAGAGISIIPVAFLVVKEDGVKLIPITLNSDAADKLVSMIPEVAEKVSGFFAKRKAEKEEKY